MRLLVILRGWISIMNMFSQKQDSLKGLKTFILKALPSILFQHSKMYQNTPLQIHYTYTDGLYRLHSKCTSLERDQESLLTLTPIVMWLAEHVSVSACDRRGQILEGKITWNRNSLTLFDGLHLSEGMTFSTLCRDRIDIVGNFFGDSQNPELKADTP